MDFSLKDSKFIDPELLDMVRDESYLADSDGVEVRVWPEFVTSQQGPLGDLFIWSYRVRIDNKSDRKFQLVNRYWRIIDENGVIQEVSGEGVIGKQPNIAPGESFEYNSGVHLDNSSGMMGGKYEMKGEDGSLFGVEIPTFSLSSPFEKKIVN